MTIEQVRVTVPGSVQRIQVTIPDAVAGVSVSPVGGRGATGAAGTVFTTGAGSPSGDASPGDLYMDTDSGDLYRWDA